MIGFPVAAVSSIAALAGAGGGGPTEVTIYSDPAADGGLEFSNADNAVVRASDGAEASQYVATNDGYTGWYDFGGTFYCDQSGFAFDTSSIPDGATITSVTLHVWLEGNGTNGSTLQARAASSWVGEIPTSAWRTPAQFAAMTLLATSPYAPSGGGQVDVAFTSEAGFPAAINKTGYTYIWLVDAGWAADATTTNDAYTTTSFGEDDVAYNEVEDRRPYLVIEYTE